MTLLRATIRLFGGSEMLIQVAAGYQEKAAVSMKEP